MKRTIDDIERLRAELKYDTKQIETLQSSNQKAAERIKAGVIDYLDYAALGYTIHNFFPLWRMLASELQNSLKTIYLKVHGTKNF